MYIESMALALRRNFRAHQKLSPVDGEWSIEHTRNWYFQGPPELVKVLLQRSISKIFNQEIRAFVNTVRYVSFAQETKQTSVKQKYSRLEIQCKRTDVSQQSREKSR